MIKIAGKAGGIFLVALAASTILLAAYLQAAGTDAPEASNQAWPTIAEAANSKSGAIDLVRRLNLQLEQHPRDARAWTILARLQFEMEHFTDAARSYEKALALPSKVANDPAVWCEYADALGMTREGKLTGRPRELIDHALALNPRHPKALEMAGSAEYAQGDYTAALRFWRPLLAALEPGSQAHTELAAALARTERLAMMEIAAQR